MLEAYQAYGDYTTMMELTEVLVRESARAVNPVMGRDPDTLTIPFRGKEIDLTPSFRRLSMLDAVSSATEEQITPRSHRPPRDRGTARCPDRRRLGSGQDRGRAVREARRRHDRGADLPLRLPAGGVTAREAAPIEPRSHGAFRPHHRRRGAGDGVLRTDGSVGTTGEARAATTAQGGGRRGDPSARRGLPPRPRARHAAGRGAGARHRPAHHGAHRRAVAP